MKHSHLVELIEHLTTDEQEELTLFVASPYFNRGVFIDETQVLLRFILSTAPDFSEEALLREKAYTYVCPGNSWVEGKLDKIMSELHKMAKNFVEISNYNDETRNFQRLLDQAIFFGKRQMDNRHQNVIQKLEEILDETERVELNYFVKKYELDSEISSHKSFYEHRKKDDLHLIKTIESLDLQNYALKTNLISAYLLQAKLAKLEIPEGLLETFKMISLDPDVLNQYPVLIIATQILNLLLQEEPDISDFERLQALIKQHEHAIGLDLLQKYFSHLRNFCTFLLHSGQAQFLPVLFNFQQEHYERGYLFYNGKIVANTYINITNIGLRVGKHAWVRNFIEANAERILEESEDNNYYRLCMSLYYLHTKEYEKGIEILPQYFQELDVNLLARRLELKLYYELESDLLPYKIDAFKMYLSRSSKKVLPEAMKERHTNFINILLQMSQTARGNAARAERILKRIEEKQVISDREWLVEKAQELAKFHSGRRD